MNQFPVRFVTFKDIEDLNFADAYAQDFLDGYKTVVCYGMAFFKKRCLLKRMEVGIERK